MNTIVNGKQTKLTPIGAALQMRRGRHRVARAGACRRAAARAGASRTIATALARTRRAVARTAPLPLAPTRSGPRIARVARRPARPAPRPRAAARGVCVLAPGRATGPTPGSTALARARARAPLAPPPQRRARARAASDSLIALATAVAPRASGITGRGTLPPPKRAVLLEVAWLIAHVAHVAWRRLWLLSCRRRAQRAGAFRRSAG